MAARLADLSDEDRIARITGKVKGTAEKNTARSKASTRAIAAALIHPDRRVLAVCGDGGFMMNSQELETAVRLKLNLVVLVLEDRAYGMIRFALPFFPAIVRNATLRCFIVYNLAKPERDLMAPALALAPRGQHRACRRDGVAGIRKAREIGCVVHGRCARACG